MNDQSLINKRRRLKTKPGDALSPHERCAWELACGLCRAPTVPSYSPPLSSGPACGKESPRAAGGGQHRFGSLCLNPECGFFGSPKGRIRRQAALEELVLNRLKYLKDSAIRVLERPLKRTERALFDEAIFLRLDSNYQLPHPEDAIILLRALYRKALAESNSSRN